MLRNCIRNDHAAACARPLIQRIELRIKRFRVRLHLPPTHFFTDSHTPPIFTVAASVLLSLLRDANKCPQQCYNGVHYVYVLYKPRPLFPTLLPPACQVTCCCYGRKYHALARVQLHTETGNATIKEKITFLQVFNYSSNRTGY